MADEAVSIAAPGGAPDTVVNTPEPIKTTPNPEAGDKPASELRNNAPTEKKPTMRETLEKAKARVDDGERADAPKPVESKAKTPAKAAPKTSSEPAKADADPGKEAQPRGEGGKFAARTSEAADDDESGEQRQAPAKTGEGDRSAPKRFVTEARDLWDKLGPEADVIKDEVLRMERNQNAGIEKHRAAATRYDQVYRPYDELAQRSGVDAVKVLQEYVELDTMINNPQTFVKGIERILNGRGVTLQQFAQHVLGGQAQDGTQRPANAGKTPNEVALENKIIQLEQQMNGVGQHLQQQTHRAVTNDVQAFAQSPGHEHFDLLAERIASLIANDGLPLQDAYDTALAEAQDHAQQILGSVGAKPASRAASSSRERDEQIAKGSASIKGAPSAGSAPAAKKPASSIQESLQTALRQVG